MQKEQMEPIVKKFYEGLEEGKLYGRKCPKCGAVDFPPRLICNTCGHLDTEWIEMSGRGKLLSLVVPGIQNDKPYLKAAGKYGYGAVEFEEGCIYTFVVYGITKKNRVELNARIKAGETVGVHPKFLPREEGWTQLCFELD